MAATEGVYLNEENLVNLLQAIMNKMASEMPSAQLKELFTQIEANTSLDSLLENLLEIHSIESVSLSDTQGEIYYKFEKEFLNAVS